MTKPLTPEAEGAFADAALDHRRRVLIRDGNFMELSAALDGFTKPLWASERQVERYAQVLLISRRLFNWLSAEKSLTDLTWSLIRRPPFGKEDVSEINAILPSDQLAFFDELRNLSTHSSLPDLPSSLEWTQSKPDGHAVIRLNKLALVRILSERGKREAKARRALAYLESRDGKKIDLRSEVTAHHAASDRVMLWFRERIKAVSVRADELLMADESPEPVHMSSFAREMIRRAIDMK